MVIFKRLRYKNFLSTGASFTEIKLNHYKSTLIVGDNGAGKSTMLDALSFGLFGKPHRSVTKSQLVNSINQKGTVVEVEFELNGSEFKVVRGIKPNKFEIYKDDEKFNENSHAKEYQQILEQNILKLNHKSFHQVVVLGSSSFVPFMQLPANHRREVIEDLLDINVFSKMNQILRERTSLLKENVRANSLEYDAVKVKKDTQKKYVERLIRVNEENKKAKQEEIDELMEEIESLQSQRMELPEEPDFIASQIQELRTKKNQLEKYEHQFKTKQKQLMKDTQFYENNTSCPTCEQDITDELKGTKISEAKSKFSELESARERAESELKQLEHQKEKLDDYLEMLNDIVSVNDDIYSKINAYQTQIASKQTALQKANTKDTELEDAKIEYENILDEQSTILSKKEELAEDSEYNTVIQEMLKDTGIKTKIIKQYLPVINNLVNKYLQTLDFYVSFNLDDTFKETIKSRHRDTFSYASFSEGEKQRIDLALLFTWRHIARMKNSVATNLLILDETFDSSLDVEGIDNLTTILDSLEANTNTFVISHKGEMLFDKFDSKLEFVKEKNFSKLA